jgi:putative mRNA 3-end processing factor
MNLDENSLLRVTDAGLYCEQAGLFIDPWCPVDRAVVTHAHSDHLCRGSSHYLVAHEGLSVARARLDERAEVRSVPYGELIEINGAKVSLHPAGHILGSAQVRLEQGGEI